MSDSCGPMAVACQGSLVQEIFPGKNTGVLLLSPPGDLPPSRDPTSFLASPALAGGSLPVAPPGKCDRSVIGNTEKGCPEDISRKSFVLHKNE